MKKYSHPIELIGKDRHRELIQTAEKERLAKKFEEDDDSRKSLMDIIKEYFSSDERNGKLRVKLARN